MSTPVSVEIPPRSPYVGVVRLTVAALARTAGFDEERVEDLRMAVSEACANAVLANEEAGSSDAVVVDWHQEDDRVVIEIGDRGPAPATEASTVDTDGFSSRLAMSVALLESLVDEFSASARAGGGTTARLVMHL